jgi:exodeoxyribonuclease III
VKAKLLCWNVAGRGARLAEQADLVVRATVDVVCLQEVTAKTAPGWREALKAGGYGHIALGQPDRDRSQARPLLTLTAARLPLEVIEIAEMPWPERVLATSFEGLELVNVHSPISSKPGLVKVRTHEAVHAHLAGRTGPRAVCGDLNTPRREHPDGRVWTFARTRTGKLRPERGERHDQAELALIQGLEPYGFRDAFRSLHGPEARELSWTWQRWGGGYRLDHLVVSDEVMVREVSYLHPWRDAGLSDHSPLFARISW